MPTAPKTFRMHGGPTLGGKSQEAYERARKYRTEGWQRIRLSVLARDGMQCQRCKKLIVRKGDAIVDHILEVANGGSDDESNLRTLCASCHSKRHGVGGWGNSL